VNKNLSQINADINRKSAQISEKNNQRKSARKKSATISEKNHAECK
jgi:hypothetical protein